MQEPATTGCRAAVGRCSGCLCSQHQRCRLKRVWGWRQRCNGVWAMVEGVGGAQSARLSKPGRVVAERRSSMAAQRESDSTAVVKMRMVTSAVARVSITARRSREPPVSPQ
jgi:hypothetical protein